MPEPEVKVTIDDAYKAYAATFPAMDVASKVLDAAVAAEARMPAQFKPIARCAITISRELFNATLDTEQAAFAVIREIEKQTELFGDAGECSSGAEDGKRNGKARAARTKRTQAKAGR